MRTLLPLSLLGLVLSFTGCASIVSGSTQEVGFRSTPEGAEVTINGRIIGRTPISAQLKRKDNQYVTFEKDGYKKLTLPLTTDLNGWFWGNLVFGSLVGSVTDAVSGAVHEYSPNQFLVTLEPLEANSLNKDTMLGPRAKARDFIVIGYRNIIADLKAGKGEYLTSLLDALHIEASQQQAAIKRINALADAYPDIPDFADHVAEAYLKLEPTNSANPAGDWEAIRETGSALDMYRFLWNDNFSDAQAKARALRPARRDELTDYILSVAGRKTLTWKYKLGPMLADGEMRFDTWYLKEFTMYKPEPSSL